MKKQKGLTLISWLGLLGLLLFNALIAMKVVPVYINDHSVKAMMQDIEQDSTIKGTTPKKIKEMISKRMILC